MSRRRGLKQRLGLHHRQGQVRALSVVLNAVLVWVIGTEVVRMLRPVDRSSMLEGEAMVGGIGQPADKQDLAHLLAETQRRRLFMPATPLPVRSMARDSVNRIKNMLSLHGIMKLNNERVAYINVEGMGMKSYRPGDENEELFKVTRIEDQVIEVEIAGERMELGL